MPCAEGSSRHLLDPDAEICTRCNRTIYELRCPTHDKVYSHNIALENSMMRRKWICRVCLSEGTDPFPDATEYQILMGRKLAAPSGGPLEDSPRPDLRTEFPRSFASENFNPRT